MYMYLCCWCVAIHISARADNRRTTSHDNIPLWETSIYVTGKLSVVGYAAIEICFDVVAIITSSTFSFMRFQIAAIP